MKTIDITYAGRTVSLPDMRDYKKFYGKLASGVWEPHTFEVLGHNLDRDTTYIDIGAWIGVTPFWASSVAKRVIALEPDPKCLEILTALAPAYDNVTIIPGALSPDADIEIHAVDGFGSSETSALAIGDGESTKVKGVKMEELMALAGSSIVFVKIDIEGYEFSTMAEIAKLRHWRLRGLQLAVHPQLLEKTLNGPRLWRRLQVAWRVWRLSRIFRGLFPPPTLAKYDSVISYILRGIMFRKEARGADFIFERPGTEIKT